MTITPDEQPAAGQEPPKDSFTERLKKAFDFASDSTKQLITLATGIVTLTITFAKDILTGVSVGLKILLAAAWLLYLLSILGGMGTLLALTGTLEPVEDKDKKKDPSIRGSNVTGPSILQLATFLLATLCIIIFAIAGSWSTPPTPTPALSAVPQAEFTVTTPAAITSAGSTLRLLGDGRYVWTTSGKTFEGTFFYNASKSTFRFSGTLAGWGEPRLLPDRSIAIDVPSGHAVLTRTRWMCPFWPLCSLEPSQRHGSETHSHRRAIVAIPSSVACSDAVIGTA